MTIDDLLAAIRVSDPQVTSDGRQVAYVRATTDLQAGRRNGDIWIVPSDGSAAPKLLVGGDKGESAPRFSGDGKKLAFISTRAGAPQVFVIDADGGGEARQVTKLEAGVQPPLMFSADGSRVAFVSDVNVGDDGKTEIKARRLRRLMFRHWDEWRVAVRHHVFVADASGRGEPVDVTPGDFDSPPHFYEDGGIAFSPDAGELAFVSNREGGDREAWTTNRDVWIVPVAGGQAVKLTSNPAADETPVFSPDGKSIAVRAQRRAGFESDRWYIDVYDRSTGAKRTIFDAPDLSVGEYAFSRDGKSIWFTAAEKGTENLFVVSSGGGTPQRIAKGGAINSLRVGRDMVVYAKSTLTSPNDLFALSTGGQGASRQLTGENASLLKEVAWPTPESLTARGAGGTPIQYWLLKPPGFDPARKYPVVFLIHGGPQGAWEDAWSSRWNPSLWAAQGWIVAAPNPRGSTGFGQTFVDEISQDWGGKVMADLDAVFDALAGMPFVDNKKMGIAGASYGGYAVNWIVGHTDRFRVAVSHDGVFNLESMALATEELWFTEWEFGGPAWSDQARANFAKWSPHLHAAKIKTPMLIITNELDYRVPVDQGLQLFTALRRNGVPSEALVFPDEGHWVLQPLNSRHWHEAVFGWLKKYLSDDAPTTRR
jgi:dipeptidyl aminopeptidase/acylaminoacyl peptidase